MLNIFQSIAFFYQSVLLIGEFMNWIIDDQYKLWITWL